MSKKIISILLAVVMLLSTPLVISGSGISRGDVVLLTYGEITYRYKETATGFIMEGISSDGTIVERSVFHNGIVTQEMAGGKNDSLAYVVSDANSVAGMFSFLFDGNKELDVKALVEKAPVFQDVEMILGTLEEKDKKKFCLIK